MTNAIADFVALRPRYAAELSLLEKMSLYPHTQDLLRINIAAIDALTPVVSGEKVIVDAPASGELSVHPSHKMRYSDSSLYDEVCDNCGTTDNVLKVLAKPCRAMIQAEEA